MSKCAYCGHGFFAKFELTEEEVRYLVDNIQHEYLNKDTYYFSSTLFKRMEEFLAKQDELARNFNKTT